MAASSQQGLPSELALSLRLHRTLSGHDDDAHEELHDETDYLQASSAKERKSSAEPSDAGLELTTLSGLPSSRGISNDLPSNSKWRAARKLILARRLQKAGRDRSHRNMLLMAGGDGDDARRLAAPPSGPTRQQSLLGRVAARATPAMRVAGVCIDGGDYERKYFEFAFAASSRNLRLVFVAIALQGLGELALEMCGKIDARMRALLIIGHLGVILATALVALTHSLVKVPPRVSVVLSLTLLDADALVVIVADLLGEFGGAHVVLLTLVHLIGYTVLVPSFLARHVAYAMLLLLIVQVSLTAAYTHMQAAMSELLHGVVLNVVGLSIAVSAELQNRANFDSQRALDEEEEVKMTLRDGVHRLLLNTLPAPIVRDIAAGAMQVAHRYEEVTVLQADMCGFTKLSSERSAEIVLGMLSDLFARFDALTEMHGVHKVKTIGDAYVVCCGAFDETPSVSEAARRVAAMGLSMLKAVRHTADEEGEDINIRIGVHTGTAIGGIIGTERFHFDMWGRALVGAVIMEEMGERGRIHVSDKTASLLQSAFELEQSPLTGTESKLANFGNIGSSYFVERAAEERRAEDTWRGSPPRDAALSPPPLGSCTDDFPSAISYQGSFGIEGRPHSASSPMLGHINHFLDSQMSARHDTVASPLELSHPEITEAESLRPPPPILKRHSLQFAERVRSGFRRASKVLAVASLGRGSTLAFGATGRPPPPQSTEEIRDAASCEPTQSSSRPGASRRCRNSCVHLLPPEHVDSSGAASAGNESGSSPMDHRAQFCVRYDNLDSRSSAVRIDVPAGGSGKLPRPERFDSAELNEHSRQVEATNFFAKFGRSASDNGVIGRGRSGGGGGGNTSNGIDEEDVRMLRDKEFHEQSQRIHTRRFLVSYTSLCLTAYVLYAIIDVTHFGTSVHGLQAVWPLYLMRFCIITPALLLIRAALVASLPTAAGGNQLASFALMMIPTVAMLVLLRYIGLDAEPCRGSYEIVPCGSVDGWFVPPPPPLVADPAPPPSPSAPLASPSLPLASPTPSPSAPLASPSSPLASPSRFYCFELTSDEGVAICYGFPWGYVTELMAWQTFFHYKMIHLNGGYVFAVSASMSALFILFLFLHIDGFWKAQIHSSTERQVPGLDDFVTLELLLVSLWLLFSHAVGLLHHWSNANDMWRHLSLRARQRAVMRCIEEETEACDRLLKSILPPHLVPSLGSLDKVQEGASRAIAVSGKALSDKTETRGGESFSAAALLNPHRPLVMAETFHHCSFLFAQIRGLSQLVNDPNAHPVRVIWLLQRMFDRFDKLADVFQLQKVRKTANEYYLVAAGLPDVNLLPMAQDRACAIAGFGFAMVNIMSVINLELRSARGFRDVLKGSEFSIQVGIDSGSAIAGVIGHKTYQYDLCGDAVNTAARMCTYSEPGRVHVSQATYELLKHRFSAEPCGKQQIKGKGEMQTYLLRNRPPLEGEVPDLGKRKSHHSLVRARSESTRLVSFPKVMLDRDDSPTFRQGPPSLLSKPSMLPVEGQAQGDGSRPASLKAACGTVGESAALVGEGDPDSPPPGDASVGSDDESLAA